MLDGVDPLEVFLDFLFGSFAAEVGTVLMKSDENLFATLL